MPKNFLNCRASVTKGSNLVVPDTNFNPHYVKPGTVFKFNADSESYEIAKTEDVYLICNFLNIAPDQIVIEDKESKNFVMGDSVDVSFKEYALNDNFEIASSGKGYKEGETFEIDEGDPKIEVSTNQKLCSNLKISSVDEEGSVKSISMVNNGIYINPPEGEILLAWAPSRLSGSGLEVNLAFSKLANRSVMTKGVIDIREMDNGDTYLLLDSGLPSQVKGGKISAKKKALHLSVPYLSESKLSDSFNVSQDFSTSYKIPYMVENSLSTASVYNKAMTILDQQIKRQEDRINSLEQELRKRNS